MRITALEEYGLRCALQLARHYETGPFPASQIAKQECISPEYVGKIMHLFRKAGIARAERGNQGGFVLAETPSEITLDQVFQSLKEKKEELHFCSNYTGQADECVHSGDCSVRPVWHVLSSYFSDVLKGITLQDLLAKEADSKRTVESVALARAEEIKARFKSVGRKEF